MIGNVVLNTTETTIYETGAEENFALISLLFCNISAQNQEMTLYLYNTGTAGDSNTIIKNFPIDAEDTFVWTADEKIIMGPETKLSGIASENSTITVTWNGLGL